MDEVAARAWVEQAVALLRPFLQLMNTAMKDSIADEHWRLVPDNWHEALGSFTDDDATLLVQGGSSSDWPSSLADFARSVHAALPACNPAEGPSHSLPAELRRGANPKKVHEMERLGSLIDRTAKLVGADCVVELGSGKGYLAHTLAFVHKLQVVGFEMFASLTEKANERSAKLVTAQLKAQLRGACLAADDAPPPSFVAKRWSLGDEAASNLGRSVVVGLHTCGDLAPLSMRLLSESEAVGLVSVGCCYHRLSDMHAHGTGCTAPACGYPMSRYVQSLSMQLEPCAKEFAAHDAHSWTRKGAHRAHAHRAALEVLLRAHPPSTPKQLGRVRRSDKRRLASTADNFVAYAHHALGWLGIVDVTDEEIEKAAHLVEEHTKRVKALYAVRLVLGRLTEFVILYDRVLWLHENIAALNVFLVPVFDPVLSPRNVALVATKIGGSPPRHCTEAASPPRLGSAALKG
jgi:hypothetical protein